MLDNMAERLGNEELETLRESELEALLESMRPDTGFMPEAFENFLGGLFRKAKSLVSGAVKLAKKGVGAAWNLAKQGVAGLGGLLSLPLKLLLDKLKSLAGVLLRGVLQKAIGLLPGSVQPIARTLAAKLLGEAEAESLVGDGSDPGSAVRHPRRKPDAGGERGRGREHRRRGGVRGRAARIGSAATSSTTPARGWPSS